MSDVMLAHAMLRDVEQRGKRAYVQDAERIARGLQEHGIVIVQDERFPLALDAAFRQLMLAYFRQHPEDKARDERANHQVGWTPAFTERARAHEEIRATFVGENAPAPYAPSDAKERFFLPPARAGLAASAFPDLNQRPVLPDAFPQFEEIAYAWYDAMLSAIRRTLEMAAVGFGANPELFSSFLEGAPHLLAPTGTDLSAYGPGTPVAAFHNDLNLLTGHGKSNASGLWAWTRDGRKFPVRVPDGCFVMQAGQELEILTGGKVKAGFHEVVVAEGNERATQDAVGAGNVPWRVSTTLFAHANTDRTLEPVGPFNTVSARAKYPPVLAGEHVRREIEAIGLVRS